MTTQDNHDKHPCPGGIRTHNTSKRTAADLRLRPCGHWDRLIVHLVGVIKEVFDLFGRSLDHDVENKLYGIDIYIYD